MCVLLTAFGDSSELCIQTVSIIYISSLGINKHHTTIWYVVLFSYYPR